VKAADHGPIRSYRGVDFTSLSEKNSFVAKCPRDVLTYLNVNIVAESRHNFIVSRNCVGMTLAGRQKQPLTNQSGSRMLTQSIFRRVGE
jgi:hypothetical protein